MGLSNTAVPIYYGEFRDDVLTGKIPVCEEISLQMNRIDALIKDPSIYYDGEAVEKFIRFCENEMTNTDGDPIKMLPAFKLWAEQLYGWYYFKTKTTYVPNPEGHGGTYEQRRVKVRLVKVIYIIVARGAAKTAFASFVQAYELMCNMTAGHQIVTAPTMKQGDETLSLIRTAMKRAHGPWMKFLTAGSSLHNTTGNSVLKSKLHANRVMIENSLTGGRLEVKPLSVDKLQGFRTKVATLDEWLSGVMKENPIEAIEQGASKNDDYMIIATSSEGTVRNGIGDSIKMQLRSILNGEYSAPQISIFHYKLDSIDEVAEPEMWLKANPHIGLTVTYDVYHDAVEKATNNPQDRNDILAKRFGLPMEGTTYYFAYDETLPHPARDFRGMSCVVGADVSLGDDFCAFTFLFPLKDGGFGVKARSYITALTFSKLPVAKALKYQEFIDEGTLAVFDSLLLDMDMVYDDLQEYIYNAGWIVEGLGYDPAYARRFIELWQADYGQYYMYKVRQGSMTESVPLGEIKILASQRQLLFDESIMQFTMGNSVVKINNNGQRKLTKRSADEKIDNVAALMDAYVCYKSMRDVVEGGIV